MMIAGTSFWKGRPMKSRLKGTPAWMVDRATILQPAARAGERAEWDCARREFVSGSGPHLTTETHGLLRLRLRAAALVLLVGFGVFLVRHVVGVLTGEPLSAVLLGFHVLVVLVLAAGTVCLCGRCAVSIEKLRTWELLLFGLPAAFFLILQHRATLEDAGSTVTPSPMPFWLLLIFTYGMFIPNTWRRAALVIGQMALAPVFLLVGMMAAYPRVGSAMTVIGVMQHVLVLLVAAAASVFGTQVINTLRREVFEAKQIGQYRLLKPLGAGGMGQVFLAEHRMLKRPCAIKLIHPAQAGDPQVLARFEREVRMTARLSHWNTIEIFDYGRTDDGTFFYVMEYLPGLSLEELLQRHGPLPAERLVYLLRQICQALREAHEIGLIHRDIKPGNVFAAERGGLYDVAKLLDFGLVKPVTESSNARLTQEGGISGTPLFMSPEQARGLEDVDARSDIYSVGALGYALLTGRPPFQSDNPMDVIIAHARDKVAPPSEHQAEVPADLERVILRCLAKKPRDRFQDVDSLEQALAECAAADQWTQRDAARWWQENRERSSTSREGGIAVKRKRGELACAGET
jgi:eukaryotic-like serine/threonine-protein kinase